GTPLAGASRHELCSLASGMTRPSIRIVSLAVTSAMLASASPLRAEDEERPVAPVASAARLGREDPGRAEALLRFYASRSYRPVWTKGDRLSPQGRGLLRLLRETHREGPPGARYCNPSLHEAAVTDTDGSGTIDLRLTAAFLRYAADVAQGRLDPAAANPYWAQR